MGKGLDDEEEKNNRIQIVKHDFIKKVVRVNLKFPEKGIKAQDSKLSTQMHALTIT